MSEKAGFDISSLLDFSPPRYQCRRCLALMNHPFKFLTEDLVCPICSVRYIPTDDFNKYSLVKFFEQEGLAIEFENLINHSRNLASIGKKLTKQSVSKVPPVRALMMALSQAQNFVNFTTFNISQILIGTLKMAAQRVSIRGVVSGVKPEAQKELTQFNDEAPKMSVRVYGAGAGKKKMPHQKLVVVDGLLAFKGSTNLTLDGWRGAGEGRDLLEVVTDVNSVTELNNMYFSPVWAELSETGDEIIMEHEILW
jgi:hypothetical protein